MTSCPVGVSVLEAGVHLFLSNGYILKFVPTRLIEKDSNLKPCRDSSSDRLINTLYMYYLSP